MPPSILTEGLAVRTGGVRVKFELAQNPVFHAEQPIQQWRDAAKESIIWISSLLTLYNCLHQHGEVHSAVLLLKAALGG
jgi:hypothetical protein